MLLVVYYDNKIRVIVLAKKVLVQIGRSFYSLNKEFDVKDTAELKRIIDSKKYDLKLLRDE
jgi:hypothetical protein